jgi:hypothetical protein
VVDTCQFCTHFGNRDCQGMWVAAYRSIYQPWSILSRRNSTSCCSLFCAASRKQRALDGTINRKDRSSLVFCFHNCFDKLAKTGSYDALSPLIRFFSFSNFCSHYVVLYLMISKKNNFWFWISL